jgi:peptidoglycan/LPS O-acetylase OafA/YrhL
LGLIPLRGATIKIPVLLAALGFFVVHVVTVETTEFARVASLARLGTFFYAGAALYFFYDRLRWHWVIAMVLILSQLALARSKVWPIVHALTLPYLVIYVAHLRIPAIANIGKAGDFSYGLYIFSFPLQQLMMQWWGQDLSLGGFMAISLVTSGIFAALSWYLVEAPAMRLKRYLPRSNVVSGPETIAKTEARNMNRRQLRR